MTTLSAMTAILIAAGAAASHAAQPSGGRQAAPASSEACTLLTTEEAAAAVGETVQQKPQLDKGSMPGVKVSACEYEAPSRSHIQITLWRPTDSGTFIQIYKSECMKKEQLPGLGDMACWGSKDHHELQVLKGAAILTIEMTRSGNTSDALVTATKKAAARLK
jgi:hypothetical protein